MTSVFFAADVSLSKQPAAVATGVIAPLLDNDPAPTNKGGSKPAALIQDQQQEAEVLDLLKQLVLVQKEVASGQVQVVQKLSALEKQVGPVWFCFILGSSVCSLAQINWDQNFSPCFSGELLILISDEVYVKFS